MDLMGDSVIRCGCVEGVTAPRNAVRLTQGWLPGVLTRHNHKVAFVGSRCVDMRLEGLCPTRSLRWTSGSN
jgi:hypothetical protein